MLIAVLAGHGGSGSKNTAVTPTADPTASGPTLPSPPPTDVPAPTPTALPPTDVPTAPPTPAGGVALPNPHLTPGQTFAGVTTADVCTPGWATSHRSVGSAQYHEVYAEYGIPYPEPSGTYELDHLIPLELGGDNDNANLWPELAAPPPGYHQKDALENLLHDRVCAGSLALAAAQHDIASNWYAAYLTDVVG
ncbi:MAG: HNH endonuclease [Candidatus Dormibacteraeota bacterium]|nr:HNH endonuclease [Candidatus Dormibacteraeota bacterium]